MQSRPIPEREGRRATRDRGNWPGRNFSICFFFVRRERLSLSTTGAGASDSGKAADGAAPSIPADSSYRLEGRQGCDNRRLASSLVSETAGPSPPFRSAPASSVAPEGGPEPHARRLSPREPAEETEEAGDRGGDDAGAPRAPGQDQRLRAMCVGRRRGCTYGRSTVRAAGRPAGGCRRFTGLPAVVAILPDSTCVLSLQAVRQHDARCTAGRYREAVDPAYLAGKA